MVNRVKKIERMNGKKNTEKVQKTIHLLIFSFVTGWCFCVCYVYGGTFKKLYTSFGSNHVKLFIMHDLSTYSNTAVCQFQSPATKLFSTGVGTKHFVQ